MHADDLRQLLDDVAAGTVAPDDAVTRLRRLPFADLGFARVDHHRQLRQGLAEAVYGPGKTPDQCAAVVTELLTVGDGPVLLTRADEAQTAAALAANPDGVATAAPGGSTVVWRPGPTSEDLSVVIATAGTADLPVADEADTVLAAHGVHADRVSDVGVAGVHRLLGSVDRLCAADVVIVVAGMEGALASVVGGIAAGPVIAVPTSVGYGSAFEGVTALLAMLSSCAAGVSVVGIDNGYGAAIAALRLRELPRSSTSAAAEPSASEATNDPRNASPSYRSEPPRSSTSAASEPSASEATNEGRNASPSYGSERLRSSTSAASEPSASEATNEGRNASPSYGSERLRSELT